MENKYKISSHLEESGCEIYIIYDSTDNEFIESYDDKQEAQEALKFWNK